MRGYDRYDEYEDLDEYEEDGYEQEEEAAGEDKYEEEEAPERTKEVLDYLELRQRLKEEKRKKLKKESGSASREKKNAISKDSYGSFFGPSQPVIAQRVIQESKSLLENPNLAAKVIRSNQSGNKGSGSAASASKSQSIERRPKVTNGLQKKVEMLKNTRDYSFLLSDDAELPAPKKDRPARYISTPKPEARSAQLSERIRDPLSNNGRKVSSSREDKKPTAAVNRMQPKVGSERFASGGKPVRPSVDSRKHLGGSNGTLADHKRQVSSSNGSGPGRPVLSKSTPSKAPVVTADKKASIPVARTSAPGINKPNPSKLHAPVSKQASARKEEYQAQGKPRILPKQPVPPPKPKQVMRPPPKTSARDASRDERPRKRPVRRDDDDEDPEAAISMIRKMFGYNPRRFEDADDDSDMEANFDDIMREEKRSARIARQEDEEELRKIEEEERRERLRKEAKKRKLSHR